MTNVKLSLNIEKQKVITVFEKIPMPIRWRYCEIKGWRPETREGATITTATLNRITGPAFLR